MIENVIYKIDKSKCVGKMKTANLYDVIAASPFTVLSDIGVLFCRRLCKQCSSNKSKVVSLLSCSNNKKDRKSQ